MTIHVNPETLLPNASAPKVGSIALVGADPGARDLLTLRRLDRLRAADVIYYDRLVTPEVLERFRRSQNRQSRSKLLFLRKSVEKTGSHFSLIYSRA